MRKWILCLGLLLAMNSAAKAQVFFEPVRYQYCVHGPHGGESIFYYGGSNPAVFDEAARRAWQNDGRYGVCEGIAGVGLIHRGLVGAPPITVYSDFAPYQNVAIYGYTAADARNEASARVPRYFTKAGLLAIATPAPEPTHYQKATPAGIPVNSSRVLIVPSQGWPEAEANAPNVDIRRARPASVPTPVTGPTTRPATSPPSEAKPLLIIPKRLLNQPLGGSTNQQA